MALKCLSDSEESRNSWVTRFPFPLNKTNFIFLFVEYHLGNQSMGLFRGVFRHLGVL